jgi:AraC-like DNA-binding protein
VSKARNNKNPDGNTRDVNAGIRASLALKLRAQQHLSYAEIAQQCGFASKGAAHNAVQRELQRTISTNVDEMRREELATLDYLEMMALKRLRDETYEKQQLFAFDRILQIMERRSKLMGLDAQPSGNVAVAGVIVREVPAGYLGEVKE